MVITGSVLVSANKMAPPLNGSIINLAVSSLTAGQQKKLQGGPRLPFVFCDATFTYEAGDVEDHNTMPDGEDCCHMVSVGSVKDHQFRIRRADAMCRLTRCLAASQTFD